MFLRYRFKRINFKFRSNLATSFSGNFAMGVIDDTAVTSVGLNTADQMLNLRVHKHAHAYQDCSISWRPVDRAKWYYVNAETSSSDARWTIPGVFGWLTDSVFQNLTTVSTSPGTIDVDYVIEFSGSANVAV